MLQRILQDFQSVTDHFGKLYIKVLKKSPVKTNIKKILDKEFFF